MAPTFYTTETKGISHDINGNSEKVARELREALEKIPEALATEGFGVLTEIDVQQTLKNKIGVDSRRYKILGRATRSSRTRRCRPSSTCLMLPCNVVVYERDDGTAAVTAIDPMQTVAAHGGKRLREIASTVRDKLDRALGTLEGRS